jgi:sensor histidine kinase YesM
MGGVIRIMNCKEAHSFFPEFFERELTQDLNKILEAHLAGFSECRKQHENSLDILNVKKRLKHFKFPGTL